MKPNKTWFYSIKARTVSHDYPIRYSGRIVQETEPTLKEIQDIHMDRYKVDEIIYLYPAKTDGED